MRPPQFLNLFSFGCAGFNTVLGPLRPYAMACTLSLQALVWRAALSGGGLVRSALGGTLLCLALTLLPEALDTWQRGALGGERGAQARALTLAVSGMGCTACTAKVQAALSKVEGVAACTVDLAAGTATLQLADAPPPPIEGGEREGWEAEATGMGGVGLEEPTGRWSGVEQRAIAAVDAAGFGAKPARR